MKKFNCPSCGAEVAFQSNVSVYAVCKYCNSMIVRHDIDVESIGKMAALPDDMSPLQIGTEGFYRGRRFGIIGRFKMGWADGFWNEWFLMTDDSSRGWLVEAQGNFAVCFEVDYSKDPALKKIMQQLSDSSITENLKNTGKVTKRNALPFKLGSYLTISKEEFKVVDIKSATCVGSEGELPFSAIKGRKSICIDLLGSRNRFATIEIADNGTRVYLGNYIGWNELRCQRLRPLEGW